MSGFDSGFNNSQAEISKKRQEEEARQRAQSERVSSFHSQIRSWQKLRDWGCAAILSGREVMIKSAEGVDLFKIEFSGDHVFGTDVLNMKASSSGPGFVTEDIAKVPEFVGSAFARSIDELKKNPQRARSAGVDLSRFD